MANHQRHAIVLNMHSCGEDLAPLHSFESSNAKHQTVLCKQSGCLLRHHGDSYFSEMPDSDDEVICQITPSPEGCTISPPLNGNDLGLALGRHGFKAMNAGCRLSVGNEIRLGSISLLIRDIQGIPTEPGLANELSASTLLSVGVGSSPLHLARRISTVKDQQCRICLSAKGKDPLINPCLCTGSVGTLHISCLKQWLNSKLIVKKDRRTLVLRWQKFRCELCHEEYPDALEADGELYELIHVPRTADRCMVFELNNLQGEDKVLYVTNLDMRNQIVIGSAVYSDIVLNDPSVSERHAVISVEKSGVFYMDCGSRFGSCVILHRPVTLHPNDSLVFQYENTVFAVHVKKQRKLGWFFCG